MGPTWDHETDLVVVGSGAAGMLAAIVAASRGQRTIVVEREPTWGGTSAWSGGGLWMPNNPLMQRDGAGDSPEKALTYMDACIGEVGPASSPERRKAYVATAPKVVQFLADEGVNWVRAEEYPDYYPDRPGGMIGRGVEADVLDGNKLGDMRKTLAAMDGMPAMALTTRSVQYLPVAFRTIKGFLGTTRMMLRTLWWRLTGRDPLPIGNALLGSLGIIAQRHRIPIWLESPMVELVEENGGVTGIVVEREGRRERVRAHAGVMLTAGGFAKNSSMRRKYQPVGGEYTSVSPGDQGEAILAGKRIKAATALMDDAWWGASFLHPDGSTSFSVHERSMPGCILVGPDGQRFCNESASYIDVGHAMLELNPGGDPPPTWLIMDARHRRRYMFGQALPGQTPKEWFTSGFMKKADTLRGLAEQCGIDPDGLEAAVQRFNGFARAGRDEDFHRGATAYDNYYGDARNKPNPNLLPIERGPFLAARMVPGDLGTKGGLLTDEHARVLRVDGSVIRGLYAAGNTTASVMGRTYPGPGSTLGPSTTFAFLGAQHALDVLLLGVQQEKQEVSA